MSPSQMTIRPIKPDDCAELFRLKRALFDYLDDAQFEADQRDYWRLGQINGMAGATFVLVRLDDPSRLGGFVDVSLRSAADGCLTHPVGYVEAWFVDPDLRRNGWGRRLVEAAEDWARSRGCVEMGSDCLVENEISLRAHQSMGYEQVDRSVNFRKSIAPDKAPRGADWIELTSSPLSASAAVDFVTDERAGGIDVFLGTTRQESADDGRTLIALDYEAYTDMALKQLHDLARFAREKFPVIKLALLHRTGRVALGDPSVVIAVSCPHRGQAFDACRFLIDALKADVAIWKKEVWDDGSSTWVHPTDQSAIRNPQSEI
jgi:molybdopterin synthase catalytic subunit